MVKATTRCKFRKIYPVRYAITSEEKPPAQAMGGKFDDTGPAVSGYLFTLRTLREGFVHIYLEKTKERRTYKHEAGEFVLGRVQNGLFRASGSAAKSWIEVEQSESSILIAYSEVEWTEEFWGTLLQNTKKRAERMQQILLDDAASGKHTALLKTAPTLVEEFRQAPGFLNSMREQLPDIFDPDMEKSTAGLTDSQVFSRWQHSDVPIGQPPPKWENPVPVAWQPNGPPQLASVLAGECSTTPLLVAVHDPFGVSRDMGAIHASNLAAMAHYMAWNDHPLAVACYLHGIEESIQQAMRDCFPDPPTPDEYIGDDSPVINGGLIGVMQYSKMQMLLRKVPKAKQGWKDFLHTQKNTEATIKQAIHAHIEVWDTWLANDARASLLLVFSDFDPVQWAKREASFAQCHMLFTIHPEYRKRKEIIYFSTGTQHQQLFESILKDGTKVTKYTDMLILNFSTAIIEKGKVNATFFEQVADNVQKRMTEVSQKEACAAPEPIGDYLHDMVKLTKEIAKGDKELLEMITLAPPEKDSLFTLYNAIKKIQETPGKFRVNFVPRYRPSVKISPKFPREARSLLLRLNGIGQILTSCNAALKAKEKYDKTQDAASMTAALFASISFATTCVTQGLFLHSRFLASSFQLAAGWFLTILLCAQLCVVLFQQLHKKEYSKAINTGLILGGGTLSIAGSISRMSGRAALGSVLSGWGLILILGGALLEYLQDHGPLGDWLEKCYWNKNSPLYSSDDEEKFSYKKNQHRRKKENIALFLENLTEFYKIYCLPVVQQPYSEGEFIVFSAAVNMFEVPSGRLELMPQLMAEMVVYGVTGYDRLTSTSCGSYPVPFSWSKCEKKLEIFDSGGAICRLAIPQAEAEAAFQKAQGAGGGAAFPGGNGGEGWHGVMRFILPVWRVTATYTDRNNILCSAPERTFWQYLPGGDKPGAKPLLSTGKR